jgi:hypothetical protein
MKRIINLGEIKDTKKRSEAKKYLLNEFYNETGTTTQYQLKKKLGLGNIKTAELYELLQDINNEIVEADRKHSIAKFQQKVNDKNIIKAQQIFLKTVKTDKHYSRLPEIEQVAKFKNSIFEKRFTNPKNVKGGYQSLSILGYAIPHLRDEIKRTPNLSVLFSFNVLMENGDGKFNLGVQIPRINIFNIKEIVPIINDIKQDFKNRVENVEVKGSGSVFLKIESLFMSVAQYKPFKASSYIKLDSYLSNKKCCINIKNTDQKCLMYCVLYHLHKDVITTNADRVSNYAPYLNQFDWKGISFPVAVNKIDKVEKLVGFPINVWGYDPQHSLIPFPLTKPKDGNNVMNLLYITEKDNAHYVYITKIDVILRNNIRDKEGVHKTKNCYTCLNCTHQFSTQLLLDNHKANGCDMFEPTRIVLPEKLKDGSNPIIEFKHHTNKFKSPVVIYGDFETTIEAYKDERNGKCAKVGLLEPCGYSFNVVSDYPELNLGLYAYRGDNVLTQFLKTLLNVGDKIKDVLKVEKPMEITEEEQKAFDLCNICSICDKHISTNDTKARDHDHITGKYRGCAHQKCNVNFNHKNFKIPTFFHNLKGFDGHLIIQGLKNMKFEKIDIIAQNFEKYMTISFSNFKMLDSFAFLASSLDKLSSNLLKDGMDNFKHTINNNKHLSNEQLKLMLQKGVYPYEYMDSKARFEETQLPPIEAFYSSLSDSGIKKEEYKHALKVWESFNIKNLGEYHDLYLKCDVLLLSDVFETFRTTAMNSYGLDPANGYLTLPNFAWDAMLKQTKIRLEQITDIDMYILCEKGIRGGISMISHRYAKANNKYMQKYDPTKETSYISYLDANNLYGGAMCEKLPYGNFKWVDYSIEDIERYDANGNNGVIVECDLDYPAELHDIHNDYPLAPETRGTLKTELSPYQLNQIEMHKEKHNEKLEKLMPNLYSKNKYVVHIKNLQYYISKGLILKKVYRVLEFSQREWLKEYIDFNTDMRKNSKNDFEKDFYKLMNNAVFGKTMENMRARVNIKLFTDEEKALYQIAKPQFLNSKIYSKDLIAIQQVKKEVELNKPIYVGLSVLDLSKLHMYKFHYDYIKPKYGSDAQLLFTDTDSLTYHIKTEDIYKDNYENKEYFDMSDYNMEDEYRRCDNTNKKVIGKFKDETSGVPIVEFVGLRPKMYSILLDNGKEKKTGKGIKSCILRKDVSHEDYRNCILSEKLEHQRQNIKFNNLRTFDHNIYTYQYSKVGLSCSENKRYLLDNGIKSYAYGHYKISNSNINGVVG